MNVFSYFYNKFLNRTPAFDSESVTYKIPPGSYEYRVSMVGASSLKDIPMRSTGTVWLSPMGELLVVDSKGVEYKRRDDEENQFDSYNEDYILTYCEYLVTWGYEYLGPL